MIKESFPGTPRESFYLTRTDQYYPIEKARFSSSLKQNIKSLIALYSYGYDLDFLDEYLANILAVKYPPTAWVLDNMGDFYLAISLVSWIQLRHPNFDWSTIDQLIPIHEDRFLSFLASDKEELDYTKIIKNLDPYIYLHNFVVDQRRVEMNVTSFLRHFYQAQKGLAWHDSHIENHKEFFGYWSFSLAAIVHKLELDDIPFIDHMYYPRDLLGRPLLRTWEDSIQGEKDRIEKHKLQEEYRQRKESKALNEEIYYSFQKHLGRIFSKQNNKVFDDSFFEKIDKLQMKKAADMKDMKEIKTVLTAMGKSIRNIKIDKNAFEGFDAEVLEKAIWDDISKNTGHSEAEIKEQIGEYISQENLEKSFSQWAEQFGHLGEMLVSLNSMYDHQEEEYWQEIEQLMSLYGFSKLPDFQSIKNSVAAELKERLNKKLDLSNFEISLDEFLNKKL